MSDHRCTRRGFLIHAASAVPVLGALATSQALAAPPKLPVTHAQAKALAYTETASTVKHASFKAGSKCSNCQFFNAATSACAIFPGFTVAAEGWCSAWAKKA